MRPTIGRIVIYRSRTGKYDVPAMVTATTETLNPEGVEKGNVPALSSDEHVHLTVFTPGKPGLRASADDFEVPPQGEISENVAGCYQEWDIPHYARPEEDASHDDDPAPGSWRWPEKV